MTGYPERHHPVFFLEDALCVLGADVTFARNERTQNCYGLIVNGRVVVWLIDNRLPNEITREDAAAVELHRQGALVLCAQKPDAERVGGKWLPLAVTPGYRMPDKPVEKLYDVAFVGYIQEMSRMQVLSHVARHFNLCVQSGVFGDAAVTAYWQAKVGLNVPTGYGAPFAYDSFNMRAPEILATGTPLVTPYEPYLADLGLDLDNSVTYCNPDELIEHIRNMIDTRWDLLEIGGNGAKLATERHTYAHRAAQVLEWLK